MAVTLAAPAWLLLLPPLVFWLWWVRNRPTGEGSRLVLPTLGLFAAQPRRAGSLWGLRLLALALLVLALARPQSDGELLPVAPPAREIVLLLDSSLSMTVADMQTEEEVLTRLDALKRAVDAFVEARRHDRFALVAFADHAATLVPMTSDKSLVRAMLARLVTGAAGEDTAIGDALGLALRQVNASEGPRPLVLLFSDGDNTAGHLTPSEALAVARQTKVAFYTVAVSADVSVPIDGPSLNDLARHSGGRSYHGADPEALAAIIRDVDRREATVAPPPRRGQRDWYPWPLLAGALLLGFVRMLEGRRS